VHYGYGSSLHNDDIEIEESVLTHRVLEHFVVEHAYNTRKAVETSLRAVQWNDGTVYDHKHCVLVQ